MKDLPLIHTGKAALISLAALVLPVILLALSPVTGLYSLLICLFVLPMGICTAAMVGGLAPAGMGLIAGVIACFRLLGQGGLWLSALYLGLICAAFLFVMIKKPGFFQSCGIMILSHMAGLCILYVYAQNLCDQQLYRMAGEGMASLIATLPECDTLLMQCYSMGLISLTPDMKEQIIIANNAYVLTPIVRQDMLLSLSALVEMLCKSLMPMILVGFSILSGILCLLLSQRFGKIYYDTLVFKAAEGSTIAPFADLKMPPLSLWHLPRGIGWKVGLCWVLGTVLQGVGDTAALAGAILYYAADAIFIFQGAALLNFTQKAKGTRRPMRILLPCLFFCLGILAYMGLFDQVVNLRGLRKPPEPKEEI